MRKTANTVKPRIGVFICHCGTNIGGVVDVPRVTEYAKTLPNVVHAEHNLYTCSEDGLSSIRKKIVEKNLNRVVVAACTPRTHEQLFKNTCEQAGLNKYLFEFVNIREHCSWIHMNNKEEATRKAQTLVRMGVRKAELLKPQQEATSTVEKKALVIGGGVTGMVAAKNLANQGFPVHLVEREETLGGTLKNINKLFPGDTPAEELLGNLVEEIHKNDLIKLHMPAEIKNISGYVGNFDVTIQEKKLGKEETIKVGTIIVATGAKPLKPTGIYGYGEIKGVLTQLDLEQELRRGMNKDEWKNIVMINCVGTRTPERPYCSKICCMTTIKNASLLRECNPGSKVYVLHRDIMALGVEFEEYFRRSMELGVRYIRYSPEKPPEIIQENKKLRGVRVYHETMGREIELPADHLVLATPLVPQPDSVELAKMLKVPLGEDGFFLEAHVKLRPVEFATDGVYVAGSAHWPTYIDECVSQGYAAAAKAAIPMRRGYIVAEAITAVVDEEACTGCGACVASCPYTAITLVEKDGKRKASVNAAQCKGCGTCVASCVNGAIQQNGYTDEQLLNMIEALVEG